MLATRPRRARNARKTSRPKLSPEEREARISAARQQLLAGIDTLLTSEGWQQLIQSRAWLRRYSLANVLMILQQYPAATDVRPMSEWKELGFGYMRRGTHKIKIWKPCFRKVEAEQDDTEDTTVVSRLSGFMLVPVVDISQLQGDPRAVLPQPPTSPVLLTGDAPIGLWESIERQIHTCGYTVERGDCGDANGMTVFADRRVIIRPDLEPAQAAKTLTHELAHILCEHEQRSREVSRALMEVEAESVACIVSSVCGLDSLSYSVPYVAHWATDREIARLSAERVLKVADQILDQIDDAEPPR
ncbi:ImmA/IrrE family metallo-endopeptidase [Kibdelosporangium aridum]|uniref:ImmA/IrrE family metallo-endopeptidase n=1 Tax=Kibdelosporangium aridum TaxID=2030 RepID=UPI0035F0CEE4